MPGFLAGLTDVGGPGSELHEAFELGVMIAVGGVQVDVQPGLARLWLLPPTQDDDRLRSSEALGRTPLDIVLRDCGVRAYLIAGVATEVGIEPTVRHSADLGYIPVIVRDACGAGDDAAGRRALESLAFAGDAVRTDTDTVCSLLAARG